MEFAAQPFSFGKRATVSNAKLAYLEGDFERCLEICAQIRVGSIATASEVALLTARALLRIGRPREAQNVIVDALDTHLTLDASLTAQMLVATARIRQDDVDTAIAILLDAAARSDGAHFAVRSEIALTTATGYWAKRDVESAQTYLAQVDPRSETIHARALEMQAWCHIAQRDYRRSAQAFVAVLRRLDQCPVRDRFIAATAVSTLAIFAAELCDGELARFVETRTQSAGWSGTAAIHHYIVLAHQALYHEFTGNTLAAYQFASRAREVAPTVPFEVSGWALGSAIACNAGEAISAIVFAKRAQALVATLDARELAGEERFALLSTAENCAPFDPDSAVELFFRYWGLAPVDASLESDRDPRLTADETYIGGVVARARGQRGSAQSCFRKAFETFRDIGYVRRAVIAAHALVLLSGDEDARAYLHARLAGMTNYITQSIAASSLSAPPALNG
jgi:thioredoxin-like negative regulator of GroEL